MKWQTTRAAARGRTAGLAEFWRLIDYTHWVPYDCSISQPTEPARAANIMLQLRTINKAIRERGIDAELVKGNGYFYFIGDAVEWAMEASVHCFALNHLPLEQWMAELDGIVEDSKQRAPEKS